LVGTPGVQALGGGAAAAVALPAVAQIRPAVSEAFRQAGLVAVDTRPGCRLGGGARFPRTRGQIISGPVEGTVSGFERTASREPFLQRVRQAVHAGNRPGHTAGLPERGSTGYQGAGADVVARFQGELTAAGGLLHRAANAEAARAAILELVRSKNVSRILLSSCPVLDRLGFSEGFTQGGVDVIPVESPS